MKWKERERDNDSPGSPRGSLPCLMTVLMRRRLARLLIFVLFAGLFPAPHVVRAEGIPIIGEVHWAGSSLSLADEWVELWNLSDTPVSLSGYHLTGAGGSSRIWFRETDAIAPNSTFVIANYADADSKSHLAFTPHMVTTTLSLSNAELGITLMNAHGEIVDRAGDGSAAPAGTSVAPKISMLRLLPLGPGDATSSWQNATTTQNLKTGSMEFATPGLCDGCGTEIVSSTEALAELVTEPVTEPTVEEEQPTEVIELTPDVGLSDPIGEPPLEIIEPSADSGSETESPQSTDPATSTTQNIVEQASESLADTGDSPPPATTTTVAVITTTTTTTTMLSVVVTTTESIVEATTTSTTETAADTALSIQPDPLLNEVVAHPIEGQEWIELYHPTITHAASLDGWSLSDAQGTIFMAASNTNPSVIVTTPYIRIVLQSARLNNGGDTLTLHRPDRSVADHTTIPSTEKGESWIRAEDNGAWRITLHPTPDSRNLLLLPTPPPTALMPPSAPVPTPPQTPIVTPSTPPIVRTTSTLSLSSALSATTTTKKTVTPRAPTVKKTKAPSAEQKKTLPKKGTQTTKKKITTVSTTISTIFRMESTTHVRVTGTVATRPGILAKNKFVIQTPDGRGLLVQGNGRWVSPPYKALVQVTGTISINDDGAELRMTAKDTWILLKDASDVATRSVDLYAPGWEDAWSLVDVTGTVLDVTNGIISFEAGDAPVQASLRPLLHIRAERFKKGDLLRVRGLIDTRNETPRIYPRTLDEIVLIERATKKNPVAQKTDVPPWTPFGAAGATLVASHGIKRFRKMREERRIKTLLIQANEMVMEEARERS